MDSWQTKTPIGSRSIFSVSISIACFSISALAIAQLFGYSPRSASHAQPPVLATARFDEDQLTTLIQNANTKVKAWEKKTGYWNGPKSRCTGSIPCEPKVIKRSLRIGIHWTDKGGELSLINKVFQTPSEAVDFLQGWDVEAHLDEKYRENNRIPRVKLRSKQRFSDVNYLATATNSRCLRRVAVRISFFKSGAV